MRQLRGLSVFVGAAIAFGLLLAACGSGAAKTARKEGSGEIRTDLTPLIERFPALEDAQSARWLSGTYGGIAPGPSTYWIDAVVDLTDEQYTQFSAGDMQEAQLPDDFAAELGGEEWNLVTSDDLQREFTLQSGVVESALDEAGRALIISATFE